MIGEEGTRLIDSRGRGTMTVDRASESAVTGRRGSRRNLGESLEVGTGVVVDGLAG